MEKREQFADKIINDKVDTIYCQSNIKIESKNVLSWII